MAAQPNDFLPGRAHRDVPRPPARQGRTTDRGQENPDAHPPTAAVGSDSLPGQRTTGAHISTARQGYIPNLTNEPPAPMMSASGRATLPRQANGFASPIPRAPAGEQTTDRGQTTVDPHNEGAAVGSDSGTDRPVMAYPTPKPVPLADPSLAFAADILDDLEHTCNANANRLRIMTTLDADSDGVVRGFGLDARHPDVARLSAMVTKLDELVHDATLNLQRQMRRHPLGPWVKAQRGIGEKQAARLLAAVGDPYWNTLHDRPRTVSELWAYCGLHTLPASQCSSDTHSEAAGGGTPSAGGDQSRSDIQPANVAARRTKGQKANWSTNAKTRAWLCIESCMKQINRECKGDAGIGSHIEGCTCSPYRVVIDTRRAHTAVTHPEWRPGHSLNDAMRVASKELLKDLWREARRIHERQPS